MPVPGAWGPGAVAMLAMSSRTARDWRGCGSRGPADRRRPRADPHRRLDRSHTPAAPTRRPAIAQARRRARLTHASADPSAPACKLRPAPTARHPFGRRRDSRCSIPKVDFRTSSLSSCRLHRPRSRLGRSQRARAAWALARCSFLAGHRRSKGCPAPSHPSSMLPGRPQSLLRSTSFAVGQPQPLRPSRTTIAACELLPSKCAAQPGVRSRRGSQPGLPAGYVSRVCQPGLSAGYASLSGSGVRSEHTRAGQLREQPREHHGSRIEVGDDDHGFCA